MSSMLLATMVDSILHRFMQVLVKKEVPTLEAMLANAHLSDETVLSEIANPEAGIEVNRWDLIQRGNGA